MTPQRDHSTARSLAELGELLEKLDGRGYKDYKTLQATSFFAAGFVVAIDHVQGDPFADPSRLRAFWDAAEAGLPDGALATDDALRASADFLHRRMGDSFRRASSRIGTGAGGLLETPAPVQQVLTRSAARVGENGGVELRFRVGLPARGRRILGLEAAHLLCETLPAALRAVLPLGDGDSAALLDHVRCVEDAVALRGALEPGGLVAFVADGAILPRRSGVDDHPMARADAVPFRSPEGLRVMIDTPHSGEVGGMGIPAGVTVIAGGGFHGKSTLLRALDRGVYDHRPGDGRERVVAVRDAAKIRAEDGRLVKGTDISNFIRGLPSGADTSSFRTGNASGSTSQAAAIAEALEAGARCLLIDEDTSATNFMIRDARMRRLVPAADEPIVPFVDRTRPLLEHEGTSSILVVGGSGDYFEVADTVLVMKAYLPHEATTLAKEIASASDGAADAELHPEAPEWQPIRPHPSPDGAPRTDRRDRVRVLARDRVRIGRTELNLGAVEQIVSRAQTRAIALALVRLARDRNPEPALLMDAVARLVDVVQRDGLDALQEHPTGDLAEFRMGDLVAALHRLRT
ncbi:MAG: ABC-ATPase domain-containing protein [Gemmatimonadota bacterium]